MPITRQLKIGDRVQYDANPSKDYGEVIGFRANGDIAILSSKVPVSIFKHGVSKGTENMEFIWRFHRAGLIKYNPEWTIMKGVDEL